MKTLWQEVAEATQPGGIGSQGFTIMGTGEVFLRCLVCDAKFLQSDDGWAALKSHGFEEHEQPIHYDWRELHGMVVIIGVVERQKMVGFGEHTRPGNETQVELIARGSDGTIYALPFSYYHRADDGGFKWKPRQPNLLKLTQPEVGSPSNG